MKDFYQLFVKELKDIYDAEHQILKALPEMAHAAHSPKLKEAFKHHYKETEHQVARLREIGKELNEDLKGSSCEAMHGLLKEGHKILHASFESAVKDAALIGAAQRVEHYEIAVYGTLKAYAHHLKLDKVESLLNETIKEEGHADKKLTEIAEGTLFSTGVNKKACNHEKSA